MRQTGSHEEKKTVAFSKTIEKKNMSNVRMSKRRFCLRIIATEMVLGAFCDGKFSAYKYVEQISFSHSYMSAFFVRRSKRSRDYMRPFTLSSPFAWIVVK